MAHLNIPNVSIRGLAATVPALVKDNLTDPQSVMQKKSLRIREYI